MYISKPNSLNIVPHSESVSATEHYNNHDNDDIKSRQQQQLPTVECLMPHPLSNRRNIIVEGCYQQLSDFISGEIDPQKTGEHHHHHHHHHQPQQEQENQQSQLQELTPLSEVSITTTPSSEYIESGYFSSSSCYLYFTDGTFKTTDGDEESSGFSFQLDFRFVKTPAFTGALLLFTTLFVVLSAVLLWLQIFSSSNSANSKLFTFCTSRHLNSEQQLHCRRAFIRNMTLEAFNAYKKYAWGAAELGPLSKMPSRTRLRAYPGLTIVDAMSTLWLMDLKKEWAEGLHWIRTSMPPYSSLNRTLRVKEAVVDALGGLLSAYALSSELVLLEKAMEVFLVLDSPETGAFNRNTGFLAFKVNLIKKETSMAFSYNKLANVGFEQPELIWLAQLTRNRRLQRRLAQIRSRLSAIGRNTSALYPSLLELANGAAAIDSVVSLSDDSRDFYYNMIRASIQRGKRKDQELLSMYNAAIEAMQRRQMFKVMAVDGRLYVRDYDAGKRVVLEERGMEGSACQLGAMLALGAQQQTSRSTKRLHMQLAINLTETCYQMAMSTQVKMVPTKFAAGKGALDVTAYLTNELPESYFVLWRLTGNQLYRDRAWQHVESLYRHCRATNLVGYSSLANITSIPPRQFDYQFPSFFSHTLKYLWLIFADHQTVLPLDGWFFNTRGHSLPICGTSALYPKEMCR